MKASFIAVVLASCSLAFALPPEKGKHKLPIPGHSACGTPHRPKPFPGYSTSSFSSAPSVTYSSQATWADVRTSSRSFPTSAPSNPSTRSTSPTTTTIATTSTTRSTTTITTTSSITTTASTTTASSTTSTSTTTTTTGPPPVRTCELGTAFGYQEGESITLNTQAGNGCNRWGWYETPTLAELQAGISGVLYVGAGGNNIANAIDVGDWTAIASPTGGVTITYSLDPGYFLDEAHIDLDCLPIDTCAPGQYTFNSGALPNLAVYANPTPLQYPVCSGGSQPYLIIHGSINYITTEANCPPPVAT